MTQLTETSEKRPYDQILQLAAEQMIALTPEPDLARAAQEAGVSLEEAQSWFSDDRTLAVEVLEQQMVLMTDHLTRRVSAAPPDDAVAQLRTLAHAYVEWFYDNPVGRRLLVNPATMGVLAEQKVKRFSFAIYDLAGSMLERSRDAGLIRADTDTSGLLLMLRALTLGIVVLEDHDHARLWGSAPDPHAALMRMLDSYFDLAMQNPDEGP